MRRFIRNQSLSIVLFVLFLLFLGGQSIAGYLQNNEELNEHGQPSLTYTAYLGSSHFLEATMENWESEFLQMFAYVVLTAFLFRRDHLSRKIPTRLKQ